MGETVFLKLGGSLLTDKGQFETPRPEVIARVAGEIRAAREERPGLRLVLGHGSGSFGHFWAERYHIQRGTRDGQPVDWLGYARTGAAAQRLNRLVTDALLAEELPVVSVQPSASARCRDGELVAIDVTPVAELLGRGAIPLVYGDVALDEVQGCTIASTEQVFLHLARALAPRRIVLAGEVAGVYTGDPLREAGVRLIPEITADGYEGVEHMLARSAGVDVTGGMLAKVRWMVDLVRERPGLTVRIVTGLEPGLLRRVLVDPRLGAGTVVRRGAS